jgi:hypothetical protein
MERFRGSSPADLFALDSFCCKRRAEPCDNFFIGGAADCYIRTYKIHLIVSLGHDVTEGLNGLPKHRAVHFQNDGHDKASELG